MSIKQPERWIAAPNAREGDDITIWDSYGDRLFIQSMMNDGQRTLVVYDGGSEVAISGETWDGVMLALGYQPIPKEGNDDADAAIHLE